MTKRIIQVILVTATIGLWICIAASPLKHTLAAICSFSLMVTVPLLGVSLLFGTFYWLKGYHKPSELYLAITRHLIGIALGAVPILIVTNFSGWQRWLCALIVLGAGFHQRRQSWPDVVTWWQSSRQKQMIN